MSARILVVEDNRALAENVQELLAGPEVEVAICARGSEVVNFLSDTQRAQALDLAIVDMRLPGGESGLDLVPRFQVAAPYSEIIVVTGNATLGTAIDAVRQGVFAYLQKPFDPEDLIALAERTLAQVAVRREREALAAGLARSEALHRSVIETVDSLIVGVDDAFRVQLWNRWAENVTGWTAAETLGVDVRDLLFDRPAAFERLVGAATSASAVSAELVVRTKDGRTRIVHFRIAPLPGDAPLVLAAGNDITEKLALEARAAGAEALAAMGRLTAGLAHEVRNPLNAAKLQLELIGRAARKLEPSPVREGLESRTTIVQSELDRLSRLLDDFLGLARPDRLALGPTDLGEVIREVVALETPVAEAAKITLAADIKDIPRAYGDAAKLKQALVNLIVNAIEAIDAPDASGRGPKTITVIAEATEDGVEIRVEDTGPGLTAPGDDLIEPLVTTKPMGTGLGLAIVKRILELHGGALTLGDREGGGTVARLSLQVAREP